VSELGAAAIDDRTLRGYLPADGLRDAFDARMRSHE
jgi:hypothetical protein